MNVYDFDGTIYKKDSSVELYKFVIKRKPYLLLCCLPKQVLALVKYKLRLISKEKMKESYFSFLNYVKSNKMIDMFVEKEMKNINQWYYDRQDISDVIISASPLFLIERFANNLGVQNVLATEIDIRTGKFLSKNCYGEEKVKRFYVQFPKGNIDEFYSDSKSDLPLASIAKSPFWVKGDNICKWKL